MAVQNFTLKKSKQMKKLTAKTRVTSIAQLREGDVVFIFEAQQYAENKRSAEPLPRQTFMKVAAIRYAANDRGRGLFGYDPVGIMIGEDAGTIQQAICKGVIKNSPYGLSIGLTNGQHVYRLDNVRNLFKTGKSQEYANRLCVL